MSFFKMHLKQKAINGIFWKLIDIGLLLIMNMVFIMIMARIIDKDVFGIFAITTVFINFITMFVEFGVGSAIIQKEKYNKFHISVSIYLLILISILLYACIYFLSPYITAWYGYQFSDKILRIIGLSIILINFGAVSRSLLLREMSFFKLFIINCVPYLFGNLIIGITLAILGYGIWSLVFGYISTFFIQLILSFSIRPHSLKITFRQKEMIDIVHFGIGLTIVRVFNFIYNNVDKILIGKLFPMNILGIYERTMRIVMLPIKNIGNLIDGILFSTYSRIQKENKKI